MTLLNPQSSYTISAVAAAVSPSRLLPVQWCAAYSTTMDEERREKRKRNRGTGNIREEPGRDGERKGERGRDGEQIGGAVQGRGADGRDGLPVFGGRWSRSAAGREREWPPQLKPARLTDITFPHDPCTMAARAGAAAGLDGWAASPDSVTDQQRPMHRPPAHAFLPGFAARASAGRCTEQHRTAHRTATGPARKDSTPPSSQSSSERDPLRATDYVRKRSSARSVRTGHTRKRPDLS